jgi:phosphoribosyl 1,2-cyclic phosphodiesterase
MTIKLRHLGVRGSRPVGKRSLLGYGGNSTAFEIIIPEENFYLFIDGGSGLAKRGRELGETPEHSKFHFLVTHTHWDHILGYPFFKPIYSEKNHFKFYASQTERSSFNDIFFGLQKADNLPVPRKNLKANIKFQTIVPEQSFMIEDKVKIDTFQLNHQGITLGYKISYKGSSVAIITDNAPIENNHMGEGMREKAEENKDKFESEFNAGLVNFLQGVHTVVVDTHFTEQNLKADWGHSTPPRALELCKQAGNSRLVLFHHAPEDNDEDVDAKVLSVFQDACHANIEVEAAREGDVWDLCA